MPRTLTGAILALSLLVLVPAAALADDTWGQLTTEIDQPVIGYPMSLHQDPSGAVIGAWVTMAGTTSSLELVRFTPSRTSDLGDRLTVRPPALQNYDYLFVPPIVPGAGGVGLQLLISGQINTNVAPPSGTSLASLDPATLAVGPLDTFDTGTPAGLAALMSTGGSLFWAATQASTIDLSRRDALHYFSVTSNPAAIDGCCGYIPRLGTDRQGRTWLALYTNSTLGTPPFTGIFMVQLDAQGNPIGPFQKAPNSESSDNNTFELGFACGNTCMVSYQETDPDLILPTGRIVTWSPDDGTATTVVAGSPGERTRRSALAVRPDGRVWVVWETEIATRQVYRAKLGDARGGGGQLVELGSPPRGPGDVGFTYGLEALPLGNDVLAVTNWQRTEERRSAQWANVALEPGAVDTGDVPTPRIVTSPGGKLVYPRIVTGRCVRVRPVADKPARIWAQVFSGATNGTAASDRVAFRFTKPGAKSKCVTLKARPKGFYKGKVYRIKFEVRTGANAKPIEQTRPPWWTQPRITIDL